MKIQYKKYNINQIYGFHSNTIQKLQTINCNLLKLHFSDFYSVLGYIPLFSDFNTPPCHEGNTLPVFPIKPIHFTIKPLQIDHIYCFISS